MFCVETMQRMVATIVKCCFVTMQRMVATIPFVQKIVTISIVLQRMVATIDICCAFSVQRMVELVFCRNHADSCTIYALRSRRGSPCLPFFLFTFVETLQMVRP